MPSSLSFDKVEYGFTDSPCSPQFADEEPDGIKIAMPGRFTLSTRGSDGERAMLPLCMTLRFNSLYLAGFEQAFQAVKVVLVDDEHGDVLNGGVWRERHYFPRRPSKISREELARSVSTEYYTVNLLEFIRFPKRKATYKVYALLEQHKSNVVTVQIAP